MAGKGVSDQARYYDAFKWLGNQGRHKVKFFRSSAEDQAESERRVKGWDKWKLPGYTDWIVSEPGIRQRAMAMGGGASQSSGPQQGAPTRSRGGAVNASNPIFTGGGPGQDTGATGVAGIGVAVAGEFLGLNLFALDTKTPPNQASDCLNVEGMKDGGGLGPRPGLIIMYPRRNQSLSSTAAVPAAYVGRSINALSRDWEQSGMVTSIITYDKSAFGTSLASTMITHSRYQKPLWHPQHPVKFVAPTISLVSNAAGTVTVAVRMPTRFTRSLPVVASVDKLVVRHSLTTYPRDIDGEDDLTDLSVDKNYTSWDGSSTNVPVSATAGTVVYFTAWGVNKEGISQPAYFKVTVA